MILFLENISRKRVWLRKGHIIVQKSYTHYKTNIAFNVNQTKKEKRQNPYAIDIKRLYITHKVKDVLSAGSSKKRKNNTVQKNLLNFKRRKNSKCKSCKTIIL